MEHHHFNQTVTILQQDGHNLLKSMSSEQYKQILSCIKHCILATDLALFFPNKAKMSAIVAGPGIDWTEPEQRYTFIYSRLGLSFLKKSDTGFRTF
jgi:cAMP and cAMP-inhibited cGMP 3',5'-cyclic phosphodiesterase 10